MGLRQPTKTAVFFKQAQAGAEQQKKAREQLKKSQALGGSAAAGTQMIAAATGAQQQATQQVRDTAQQAGKDLNVNPNAVGGSTTGMITGTPREQAFAGVTTGGSGSDAFVFDTPPATAPAPASPAKTSTGQVFVGGIGDRYSVPSTMPTIASGEGGDVGAVEASGTAVQNQITSITNQIDDLNTKIASADAADRKALQDEKNRLEGILKSYQEKMSKENLGQIAGPSDTEQAMFEREQLLASEGQRVAKLASIFGPGWNAKRYGGLASQIYGKDLEAIQEAAGVGLEAGEKAAREAGAAEEEYTGQLETSKKGYEERLANETKKLDLLKSTPQELAGYSRKELTDLFGKDIVDKLFTFSGTDDAAKVINTKVSETRNALTDRQTKLTDELTKLPGEKEKAQTVAAQKLESEVFPKDIYGNELGNSQINDLKRNITSDNAKKAASLYPELQALHDRTLNSLSTLENTLKNAAKRGDRAEVDRVKGLITRLTDNFRRDSRDIIEKKNQETLANVDKRNNSTGGKIGNVVDKAATVLSPAYAAVKSLFK